jgi:hypothetical protein
MNCNCKTHSNLLRRFFICPPNARGAPGPPSYYLELELKVELLILYKVIMNSGYAMGITSVPPLQHFRADS